MQGFPGKPFHHVSRPRLQNPVVQAPKPVQTCSLKAEYGGNDVILFKGNKEGPCWGTRSTTRPTTTVMKTMVEQNPAKEVHRETLAVTQSDKQVQTNLGNKVAEIRLSDDIDDRNYHSTYTCGNYRNVREGNNTSDTPEDSWSNSAKNMGSGEGSGRALVDGPSMEPPIILRQSHEVLHRILDQEKHFAEEFPAPSTKERPQSSTAEVDEHRTSCPKAYQSSGETFHVVEAQSYHSDTYQKQDYAFETPPLEDSLDEAEKERRRRALAIEQQQMILKRVEAARADKAASRNRKSPRQPEIKKRPTTIMSSPCTTNNVGHSEAMNYKPIKRGSPRTGGRLFERRVDGSFVDVDTGVSHLTHHHVCLEDNNTNKEDENDKKEVRVESGGTIEQQPRPNAWDQGPPSRLLGVDRIARGEFKKAKGDNDSVDEPKSQVSTTRRFNPEAQDVEVGHHEACRPKDNWRKKTPYETKHRVKTDEGGGNWTESSRAKVKDQRSVDVRRGTNGKMDGQDKTKYRSGPRRPRKHQVAASNC